MRLKITFMLILVLLLAAACGGGEEAAIEELDSAPAATSDDGGAAAADNNTQSQDTTSQQDNTGVAARVNGIDISMVSYQQALRRAQQGTTAANPVSLERQILTTLIEQELIKQAANQMGITVSDAEVDQELQLLRDSVASSAENWTTWLAQNQYASEADLREDLSNALLSNKVRDDVLGFLNGPIPHVNARHILVATEAEANAVLQRLANGETFEALAAELSLDTFTKNNGGDLGWFTRFELSDPSLARFAFTLQPGQQAGPVASNLGYHIIEVLAFEDRIVEQNRLIDVQVQAFEEWLNALFQNATIERFVG